MIGSWAQHSPAFPGLARHSRQCRGTGLAAASQQAPVAPALRTGTRGTSEHKSSKMPLNLEQQSGPNTPLDVLTDDLRFLQAKTGLDLLTPLQEVKEVHDQVVAALNPIAGEKMQEDLEGRIYALQSELERAHREVHCSEEQLESTIEELTRLEMAAHGFTEALNHTVADSSPRSAAAASSQEATSTSRESKASRAVQQLHRPQDRHTANASGTQQRRTAQQQRPKPPDRQRSSGGGRQLHSDLELPEQLQDFWYPVAFSSQLKEGAMVTMELFGQPWVLFRDAQGLPSCVKDACAHRACPLSLGSVVDGCIQCPYHGWEYDGSGNCTKMPSTAFCRGITVSTLPVAEAEGFVWVWPGRSVPEHSVPQHVTRPPDGFTVHAELILEVPVEHGLLLENLLDLAHAPFTHTSTFAKGWPVPDVVKFNAARMLGGNWEPYPIDMAFEPPCMVLSTIGLAQPGKIERGARAESCKNHLHQLHVCLPAGPGRTRLLYRMSMDFLHWTKLVPGIQAFWAHIAQQVMGEDLVLVAGQQDRMLRGADVWAHPVAYDKLGVRYRRWRNSVAAGSSAERAQAEAELRPMSAGELFNIPADDCELGEVCDVGDLQQ